MQQSWSEDRERGVVTCGVCGTDFGTTHKAGLEAHEGTCWAALDAFIENRARRCGCCPDCRSSPCAGVLAGGPCDRMTCYCEEDDDYRDYADHDEDGWEDW